MVTVPLALLWVLVALAAGWDIAQRRIPNKLVLVGLIAGAAFQTQAGGFTGLGLAILGAATALGVLIVPFALRWMGGGDVKLTMVCGMFLGWKAVLHIILLSSLLNGVVAVVLLAAKKGLPLMGKPPPKSDLVPMAVAIAGATIAVSVGLFQVF